MPEAAPDRATTRSTRLRSVTGTPIDAPLDDGDGWHAGADFDALLAFMRRRLAGDYSVDDFGFDRELTENVLLPAVRPLYERWFRTEVTGAANIPDSGGALLVGNHAGGLWALDAVMVALAVHDNHPSKRFLRLLGADLVFTTPVL